MERWCASQRFACSACHPVGRLHHRATRDRAAASRQALCGPFRLGLALNAWAAFMFALRRVLRDEGAVVPAVLGGIVYCFFYPLPYLPETVHNVPVAVADYDSSPLSREFERNLDATREVRISR